MNIAELKARIEYGRTIGETTEHGVSVTGEYYVSIGSQHPDEDMPQIPGTIDEGKRAELGFDEETACMQALACFQLYADDHRGVLYWRQEPILDCAQDTFKMVDGKIKTIKFNAPRYKVYIRLLLSDKPVLPKAPTKEEAETAGEDLRDGWLISCAIDGLVYHARHGDPIIGVVTLPCRKGDAVRYMADHDAIMEALQVDAGDRQ